MDICPCSVIVSRSVDALYGFVEHTEHLLSVLGIRNHVSGINSGERLVIAVLELRAGPDRKRSVHSLEIGSQLCDKLLRKTRGHEFGEYLVVRKFGVDYILETVLLDELVEIVGADDYRSRDGQAHVRICVRETVLFYQRIKESETSGLAAEGTVAKPGEGYVIRICVLIETGDYSASYGLQVSPDLSLYEASGIVAVDMVLAPESTAEIEQAAGKKPLGEHVLRGAVYQCVIRNYINNLLKLQKI